MRLGAAFALICCDFPKIAAKLQQIAPNRTEIATRLHIRFEDGTSATKIASTSATKLAQKIACVLKRAFSLANRRNEN